MELLTALIVLFLSILGCFVYYAHRANQYWKERGIPHQKPVLFFGNTWSSFIGKKNVMSECRNEAYKMFPDAPLIGFYDMMRPTLIVKDINLVQRVFIKDFAHFNKRILEPDEVNFPHLENLSNMAGRRWKSLRNKMTPVFTTGKLRQMYGQMSKLSDSLVRMIGDQVVSKCGREIELKKNFDCYSMDIIGSTAFGLDIGTLHDNNSEFARMGKKVFDWVFNLRLMAMNSFPKLCRTFGVGMSRPSVFKYFSDIIRQTFDERIKSGTQRNDFVNLMLQLKEKGRLELVKDDDSSDDYLMMSDDSIPANETVEITEPLVLANAFLFIMAGFDTAGTLLTMLCLDLCQNVLVQKKLREEIRKSLDANNGIFDYEVIRDTTYLEMCIKESTRMHTLVPLVFRLCTKEYTFPGTNVTVKPGDAIEVPTHSIHMDPEIYPNPDRFDPERFAPGVSHPSCSWIPFGEGPRICIAMRFVITEVKCAIAKLLLNYELSLNPKTKLPVRPAPRSLLFKPRQPVYFDLKRIS